MRWHIGNVIEQIRTEKGMTQAELAAKAKVRPNTLGDLENRRKKSRIETLERVAEALDTTVGDLYCELDQTLKQKYQKAQTDGSSLCPDDDPEHIAFLEAMEDILHNYPRGEALTRVAIPALKAMIEVMSGSAPEGEQMRFSPDAPIGADNSEIRIYPTKPRAIRNKPKAATGTAKNRRK